MLHFFINIMSSSLVSSLDKTREKINYNNVNKSETMN